MATPQPVLGALILVRNIVVQTSPALLKISIQNVANALLKDGKQVMSFPKAVIVIELISL